YRRRIPVADCIPAVEVCEGHSGTHGIGDGALRGRWCVLRVRGGGTAAGDLEIARATSSRRFRNVGLDGLEGLGEVARPRLVAAPGLGFRSPPSWTRAKFCSVNLRVRVYHVRLGRRRLHFHLLSRSQPPRAESCTMIVCMRSGPVDTSPISTPICSERKST